MPRPLIGLTPSLDLIDGRVSARVNTSYLDMVVAAGGLPVVLAPDPALADDYCAQLDGILLTGGPDIDTRPFGVPLHPQAGVMDPRRQTFDFAMLAALDRARHRAALGICLGMQEIGVHAGCPLIQHLHDQLPSAAEHGHDNTHLVRSIFGDGPVASWHHQAIAAPGRLEVVATSHDGVIEGLRDPTRPFYVGVQWHPERTADPTMGLGVVRTFIEAARRS